MSALLEALIANILVTSLLWLLATWRRDVSLIDLAWPLLFVLSAWIWFDPATATTGHWLVLLLVMAWGARLHIHLARRNLGHGEDRRYQHIRANHSPGFWWKSYFIVFVLQAVLAWIASLSIYGALASAGSRPWLLYSGIALALAGLVYEAVADWQLARFKATPGSAGQVMDQGLWRLSRHPNYFGECCFWWGIYITALPSGWWTLVAPLLVTLLLLRVSGVSLLEEDIGERRPEYRRYIQNTPAFLPAFSRIL